MQTVFINLDVNEIVYDIQNKTFLTGKSRRDGNNHEMVAAMQANDDEENSNQVLRSVTTAYSNLKTKLSEYLDLGATTANNELVENGSTLTLSLRMPSNYNLSTVDTLAAAAHQYIVSMAVSEWFTITCKKDSPEYSALAAVSLEIISEAVNRRTRPVRHKEDD